MLAVRVEGDAVGTILQHVEHGPPHGGLNRSLDDDRRVSVRSDAVHAPRAALLRSRSAVAQMVPSSATSMSLKRCASSTATHATFSHAARRSPCRTSAWTTVMSATYNSAVDASMSLRERVVQRQAPSARAPVASPAAPARRRPLSNNSSGTLPVDGIPRHHPCRRLEPFSQHPIQDDLDRLAGRQEPGPVDPPPTVPVKPFGADRGLGRGDQGERILHHIGGRNAGSAPAGVWFRSVIRGRSGAMTVAGVSMIAVSGQASADPISRDRRW